MLFAPLRSWTSASEPAARQNTGRRWANTSPREIIRQRYFPNLLLTTQENQQVRLYDDLIKDKESHIGNVRYGNERRQLWGACPGMSKPEFIVESLSWVEWPK